MLSPGLQVNQEALAASLGVSITPLREALRRLEMEGLARLEANRTVVIAPLTARELDELYALAVVEAALGSLDRIEQFLKVTGFVASGPDFAQQPRVIDGASRIFHDVFGEAGRHARSAIGVAALPHGAAVEIELCVAVAG